MLGQGRRLAGEIRCSGSQRVILLLDVANLTGHALTL
jgi:hypothetical protein